MKNNNRLPWFSYLASGFAMFLTPWFVTLIFSPMRLMGESDDVAFGEVFYFAFVLACYLSAALVMLYMLLIKLNKIKARWWIQVFLWPLCLAVIPLASIALVLSEVIAMSEVSDYASRLGRHGMSISGAAVVFTILAFIVPFDTKLEEPKLEPDCDGNG